MLFNVIPQSWVDSLSFSVPVSSNQTDSLWSFDNFAQQTTSVYIMKISVLLSVPLLAAAAPSIVSTDRLVTKDCELSMVVDGN